jgi:serine/threonine-protein kinase
MPADIEPEYIDGDEQTAGRDRRGLVPWLVLLVVLLVLGCLLWRFLEVGQAPDQADIDPGAQVSATAVVPDVVGMTREDALAALQAAGFVVDTQTSYDVVADPGTVASQDPAAGTKATLGSTVLIGVAEDLGIGATIDGREDDGLTEVPDVTGLTLDAATARLDRDGLRISVTRAYSDSVPMGRIVSQSPAAGQRAGEGDVVSVVLSLGRSAKGTAIVPSVVGLTKAQAESRIRAAGLDPRPMWQPKSDQVGRVYQQSPDPGKRLPEDDFVFILIGLAP